MKDDGELFRERDTHKEKEMKPLGSLVSGIGTVVFLINLVSSGVAAEAPDGNPEDIRPGTVRSVDTLAPDLAVIDVLFDSQCHLQYRVKNKGGKVDPLPQYGMGVRICDKSGNCLSNVQNIDNLAESGSEQTFTCVPAKPLLTPPYTITIFPPLYENKLNNSLTKDSKCFPRVNAE